MTDECNISISAEHYDQLLSHLFPGDGDEHGAVLYAGVVKEEGTHLRLVVREVCRQGWQGLRCGQNRLSSARSELHPSTDHALPGLIRLAYLAVHNHDCDDRVGFSRIDMASHERGYPALSDIGKASLSAHWCSAAVPWKQMSGLAPAGG